MELNHPTAASQFNVKGFTDPREEHRPQNKKWNQILTFDSTSYIILNLDI